jgi:hypothetical protein
MKFALVFIVASLLVLVDADVSKSKQFNLKITQRNLVCDLCKNLFRDIKKQVPDPQNVTAARLLQLIQVRCLWLLNFCYRKRFLIGFVGGVGI